jgi:segregation and condensation protein A
MANPGSPPFLPSVQFEEFEGPLDLLLDEVRRQNVAIEKIAMAPIVSRFLGYVRTASGRSLNLDIEWLHTAATLIQWKSRSLLPPAPGAPNEDPIRDDLVQQLKAHRKQSAEDLARRRTVEEARFSKAGRGEPQECEVSQDIRLTSVWDMIQQARELAGWVDKHRVADGQRGEVFEVEPDDVTVLEMADYLRGELAAAVGIELDGAELIRSQRTASRRACLFLGMLEMVREQEVEMEQKDSFGPILLVQGRKD